MSHGHHAGHAGPGHEASPPPVPFELAPPYGSRPAAAQAPAPVKSLGHFHPMPVIGHGEVYYKRHIEKAHEEGDHHAMAAHKVGQHVTAALLPTMPWPEKFKRFEHCLAKYCVVPHDANESIRTFYQRLGDLVRRH